MSSADEYFDIPRLPDEASFPTFVGAVSPFAQQQEDPVNQSSKSPAASSTPLSNAIPEGQQEEANLSSALEEGRADSPSSSIFSVDYWQFYFNVTTAQVGSRIKASFMPQTSELERLFSTSPVDLYGPFWITITIVFLYSIIGYFSSSEASSGVVIAKASTLFLTMLYLVPLLQTSFLFVLRVMKRTNNDPANSRYTKLSFLQLFLTLISYFGYTLSPYIFSAILSSFPLSAWHWIVNVAAALLSSIVYFVNSQTFFEAWLDGLFLGFAKYSIFAFHAIISICAVLIILHS
ncbi:putative protein YIPF1/2 [Monocercomonoides exilis]|uniref:putative protein YIPF1/2 n=1 Tax=Monocercomonoides exilis TaxID=2049356 RepID=UPI0035599B78|nr:putative protein YIPF1/2 [Monocercomonoides exilis]|eukprot:MONOS_13054.1-p1 / transcript=MONOS_13054.1 / gene=MONOS_13054 / organism=Monocercomonoides_exilis_PA203 / gene_product=unspecified product / transcript_product=unspecified product / location=Mono_scaffold00772:9632-10891(-) / protein_length=291 / sequence_SO=supercontig / SO=protein_coding / is_pseudo=false